VANTAELVELVEQIEQTMASRKRSRKTDPGLDCALTGLGLAYLQQYDLEFGARLLRAATYTGVVRTQGLAWGVEYICRQQRPDGAFGYIATNLVDGVELEDKLVNISYHLPVTTACLWTITELTLPGFRLFSL
jgi:hypothetical protein